MEAKDIQSEPPPRVMVSGCFDLLHASHIAFLDVAARYGQLHVRVGTDASIVAQKGCLPLFPEHERIIRLGALKSVYDARVAAGAGILDFVPDLDVVKPDVFVVADDGDMPDKRRACESRGIRYVVIPKVHPPGYPDQSSTAIRTKIEMPYRLCLAGGWADQPWVSTRAPGSVVVVQIASPAEPYTEWSGLATSTRKTALALWGERLPQGNHEATARTLFACENPPGCQYISGSQDAIGLVYPGVSRLDYCGGYWPARIDTNTSRDVAQWLERVLHLVPFGPRPEGYDPLISQHVTPETAAAIGDAGRMAWAAIINHAEQGLAWAMNDTMAAWRKLLPMTVTSKMDEFRAGYSDYAGSCYTGAGGGYLMVVSERPVPGSQSICVSTERETA